MKDSDQNAVKSARKPGKQPQLFPVVPPELRAALKGAPTAQRCFEQLPPSHQKAYTDWVGEAKQSETRTTRARKTIERLLAKSPPS